MSPHVRRRGLDPREPSLQGGPLPGDRPPGRRQGPFLARSLIDALSEALSEILARTANDVVPAPAPKPPPGARPDLDRALRDYQVRDDAMVDRTPDLGPVPVDVPGAGSERMTRTEAALLDKLGRDRGLEGLQGFSGITSDDPNDPGLACRTADERFPPADAPGPKVPGREDGHDDAFRHAHWDAPMTRRFGEDFASAFATAREGVPGNPADKEAMDLRNSELGRRIARENPNASDAELADLVEEAVRGGEAAVIDGGGELARSDQVAVGRTGSADDPPAPGTIAPPDRADVSSG